MSNYQQTNISGESWIRSNRVVLENPIQGVPAATYMVERAINVGEGDTITRPMDSIVEPFITSGDDANLNETFDLLHPETGVVIGQASYLDYYIMVHSHFYHVAAKRDAANAPPEE